MTKAQATEILNNYYDDNKPFYTLPIPLELQAEENALGIPDYIIQNDYLDELEKIAKR